MVDLFPNREQARKMVTSLAVFWATWGVAVVSFPDAPVVGTIAVIVGLAFGLFFYLTLYRVWEPETGEPAWRMMFVPKLSRRRSRVSLHIFDLFRPRWIGQTLRVTGWNPRVVGYGLLALLATDLILAATTFPRA